jgi:hypothetical protein
MTMHLLSRTGQAPLQFEGELLVEHSGHWHHSQEQNRWHEIDVYLTAGNQYVLAITYCSNWQGECGHFQVEHSLHPVELAEVLRCYDPTRHFLGYDADGTRKAHLRRRWEAGITAVFAALPAEWFAEVIS